MDIITQNKRYLPHEITTKESAVKLYKLTKDISFVCRRYHISKASLKDDNPGCFRIRDCLWGT